MKKRLPIERFLEKIQVSESGCWEWNGSIKHDKYGEFWDGQRRLYSHRFSYKYFKGEINRPLELDHLCRNHSCVNPDHLELVTSAENHHRGIQVKLTRDNVVMIRSVYQPHSPLNDQYALARRFSVSQSLISRIILGRRWVEGK